MRRVAIVVAVLLLGACGDSGGSDDQTEDAFLDRVDAACRAATTRMDTLDAGEEASVAELADIIDEASDALGKLDPPTSLKRKYADFTSAIDDELTQTTKLSRALGNSDTTAAGEAADRIVSLSDDADDLARSMGATKCVGFMPDNALAPEQTTTTDPITTDPVTTDPVTTDPVTTDPATTDPATTDPAATVSPATDGTTVTSEPVFATDLSIGTPPPAGYTWVPMDPVDSSGLYQKPTVGPLVTFYAGGRVENIEDGHTASIYVVQLSEEWTEETIAEYDFWEGVEDGVETTTPNGVPVRQALGAFEDTDCIVFTSASSGITVCTFTGIDGLSILDAFVAAQTG
jgi:hypothetical protein